MTSADAYDVFLDEQKKREAEWASNRANKKAKTMETANKDLGAIKQQLAAKEVECATLKGQADSLQRANISVVEAVHNTVCESFCKISTVIDVKLHFQEPIKKHSKNITISFSMSKHVSTSVSLPLNRSQSMVLTQITFLQMMKTLEDTLSAMEDNMSL